MESVTIFGYLAEINQVDAITGHVLLTCLVDPAILPLWWLSRHFAEWSICSVLTGSDCQPFTTHLNGAGTKWHSRHKKRESRRGRKSPTSFSLFTYIFITGSLWCHLCPRRKRWARHLHPAPTGTKELPVKAPPLAGS
ncbi:hypothetical protein UPYG_G00084880 [Umbra pygmaea]|uniref:Uncharacterized protein n=1 Tax=Umbra pygmaea TaxID=75934 RepID=A0ABD0XTU5_UMBPY